MEFHWLYSSPQVIRDWCQTSSTKHRCTQTLFLHSFSRPSTNFQLVWAMTEGDRLDSLGCLMVVPRFLASWMYFWENIETHQSENKVSAEKQRSIRLVHTKSRRCFIDNIFLLWLFKILQFYFFKRSAWIIKRSYRQNNFTSRFCVGSLYVHYNKPKAKTIQTNINKNESAGVTVNF